MVDSARIPIEIVLILQKYTRDARNVVKEASNMTTALASATRQARQLAIALDKLKSGKIDLGIDLSSLSKAESALRGLDGLSPDVEIQVDRSQIMRAEIQLNTLDNVSPKVTIHTNDDDLQTAQRIVNDLDTAAPSLRVNADSSDLDTAKRKVDDLDSEKATVKIDGDTSGIESKLDDLKRLAKIEVIFTVAGAAIGAAGSLPILSTLGDLDAAVGKVTARTKLSAETAEKVLRTGYTNAFGESYDQLAEFLSLTAQLPSAADDLSGSFLAAMTTADVTGQEFVKTLEVMDKLVGSGLKGSFQEASDLIIGGFQLGANRSDDFLDTLREYAIQFEQGGVSAETAVDLMVQALNAGAFNTDKFADTIKENLLKIREATGGLGTGGGTAQPVLEQMGLIDEAELVSSGEMSATEFADSFFATLNEQLASGKIDSSQVPQILADVFGTPIEDLGTEIFSNLDFSESTLNFEGVAEQAGEDFYNNLSTKFTELKRVVEDELITTLKEGGLDFGQLIDDAKVKVGELAAMIREGKGLAEAIEIVLDMPGFAASVRQFESVMGNLLIGIGQVVASVVELFGGADAAAGIRATVAEQAARQLEFDIQLADDGEGIFRAVNLALSRGVEQGDAAEAVTRAIETMVSEGAVGGARMLLDQLGLQLALGDAGPIVADAVIALQEQVNTALAAGDVLGAAKLLDAAGLEEDAKAIAQPVVDTFIAEFTRASQEGGFFKAMQLVNPLEELGLLPEGGVGDTVRELWQAELGTAFSDFADSVLNIGQPGGILDALTPINEVDPVNIVAASLAMGDISQALYDAQQAGWPINEAQLEQLSKAEGGIQGITGKLSLYVQGLDAAKDNGVEALEGLKTQGYDVVIDAQDDLNQGLNAYVLGVQDQLALAKVTWADYLGWLRENGLPLPTVGGGVPGVPSVPGHAAGGHASGWSVVGERGPELAYFGSGADILNNQTSTALMSLLQQMGGGGSTTNNYINLNVLQNNNSIAAGNASAGVLSAQLRGFVS